MVHRARPGLRIGRRGARARRRPHRAANLSSSGLRLLAISTSLAATTLGCKSDPPPPPPAPVIVTLAAPKSPGKILRVEFDGRAVPVLDDAHWKLTLPSGSDPTTMASRLRIVLVTTCGDESVEVAAVSADGQLEGKWPTAATVYVDRDGVGSVVSVSVGSKVIDTASAKVVVGNCPTARELRVDDAMVGQVGASTIVDAKGGHCYELLTNGFPSARLEGKRTYERPLDLFLPPSVPSDKIALRRCEEGSASLASLLGAPTSSSPGTSAPIGAFTANPHSKSAKPPTPPAPKKPPKK